MHKVKVEVELFDKGDLVLTPEGIARVAKSERTPKNTWDMHQEIVEVEYEIPMSRVHDEKVNWLDIVSINQTEFDIRLQQESRLWEGMKR